MRRFELLSGSIPFASLDATLNASPSLPASVLSCSAATATLKLLLKDPSARPTALELCEALEPPACLRDFLGEVSRGQHAAHLVELAVGFEDLEDLEDIARSMPAKKFASRLVGLFEVSEADQCVADICAALTSSSAGRAVEP